MITETLPDLRLKALERLCYDISSSVYRARVVLRDNAEDPEASYLVADALDRIGWMADRAVLLTGGGVQSTVMGAKDWLLGPAALELLGQLDSKAAPGGSDGE